jgi:UDP-4-amino-4,6-dideoxy-N-acetyl-beta-L-altrosamine transaminase
VDEQDERAVVRVLRSDWLTTGPEVDRFERAFAERVGAGHAVAVCNGTAALHAAAYAAGVASGTEVVVAAMTFVASANCARYLGADVRFADVRRDTLCIDVADAAKQITPRTRAIVAVDFAGQPVDYDELLALAAKHNLVLIADAAHALGAQYKGRSVGTIAPLTTFSLHPVKHITTAEGGVITTGDEALAAAMRRFRNHGIGSDHRQRAKAASWEYDMTTLGYNYRLTDMQCALGQSQLPKLTGWLARRQEIAARYRQRLASLEALELPTVLADRTHAYHLYVVRLRLDRLTADRAQVFRALRAENIGVNVHYAPVPSHNYYRDLGARECPVAAAEYQRLLSLPMWAGMTDADVDDVVDACAKVLKAYAR